MRLIRSRLFSVVFRLGSLILLVSLLLSIFDLVAKREIIKDHEAALAEARRENEHLKQEVAQAQTPEYIEREARNKLNLVREGETIVLIDPGDNQEINQGGTIFSSEPPIPVWRAWWKLFF